MKYLFCLIISFCFVPFACAQLTQIPQFGEEFPVDKDFELDTSVINFPNYHFKRNWKSDYLDGKKARLDELLGHHSQNDRNETKVPDFGAHQNMPIYNPEFYNKIPIHVPDKSVHYHIQVLKVESSPILNQRAHE